MKNGTVKNGVLLPYTNGTAHHNGVTRKKEGTETRSR